MSCDLVDLPWDGDFTDSGDRKKIVREEKQDLGKEADEGKEEDEVDELEEDEEEEDDPEEYEQLEADEEAQPQEDEEDEPEDDEEDNDSDSADDEDETFQFRLGNRKLLWHGSRMANFTGISTEGLRIAPKTAPSSGSMLGKGIYFADVSSKSANYCFAKTSNDIGLMLLCEVGLGSSRELLEANEEADQLPPRKSTTMGVGRYTPVSTTHEKLGNGAFVPIGKCVERDLTAEEEDVTAKKWNGHLLYNEYIVYNRNQVRMKYLVKVKFHYK